jgi:hypothetical protein
MALPSASWRWQTCTDTQHPQGTAIATNGIKDLGSARPEYCISPHRKANSFHAPVARTDKQSLVQLEQQL